MTTAADLINGALRLLGVLAEGETPSADTANDALTAFNQMVDSWSTERLAVFTTGTQVVPWPVNTAQATIGPTGTIGGFLRPTYIDDATYFRDPAAGLDYPLTIVNQDDYNSIVYKSSTSTYPIVMYADAGMPNMTINLFPVPTRPIELHLVSATPLSAFATLQTPIALPPGYLRALRYNLALELAPEFGVEPSATIIKIGITAKRNIKRINNPGDVLDMPMMPGLGARSAFDIYAGNF